MMKRDDFRRQSRGSTFRLDAQGFGSPASAKSPLRPVPREKIAKKRYTAIIHRSGHHKNFVGIAIFNSMHLSLHHNLQAASDFAMLPFVEALYLNCTLLSPVARPRN